MIPSVESNRINLVIFFFLGRSLPSGHLPPLPPPSSPYTRPQMAEVETTLPQKYQFLPRKKKQIWNLKLSAKFKPGPYVATN